MKKICCFALFLCLLLSACSYGAGLTALPRTEEELPLLARNILPQLTGNADYTVPAFGDADGPAMEADLDGDGDNEILACLMKRIRGIRRPCVEIYTYRGDRLALAGRIVGEGDHIHSLFLPLWGDDGSTAVAVGWGLAESRLHGMTLCRLTEDGLETMYSDACIAMDTADMDRDGLEEIVFLNRSEEGILQARMLNGSESGVRLSPAVPLSAGTELRSARTANIGFDRAALLCEGYIENLGYLTDVILCGADGALQKVFCPEPGGVSEATVRSIPVPCADANGDGTVELPRIRDMTESVVPLPENVYFLDWYRCDDSPEAAPLCSSCCHGIYGWNVRLPDTADYGIQPISTAESPEVGATLFCFVSGEGERGTPLWGLYTLSGTDAEAAEALLGLRRIAVADGRIYAYQLYSTPYGSPYTASAIPGLFSLFGF